MSVVAIAPFFDRRDDPACRFRFIRLPMRDTSVPFFQRARHYCVPATAQSPGNRSQTRAAPNDCRNVTCQCGQKQAKMRNCCLNEGVLILLLILILILLLRFSPMWTSGWRLRVRSRLRLRLIGGKCRANPNLSHRSDLQ